MSLSQFEKLTINFVQPILNVTCSGTGSHEGRGLEPLPFCGKYDVIFSYIYSNATKLVLHLSYLVRLDYFSNAFN